MDTVHVNEVTRRYKIPHSALQLKPRLNDLTEHFVREYFDLALQHVGHKSSDILCIKTLYFPLSFNQDKTNQEHYQQWLKALAIGIQNVLSGPQGYAWARFPSIVAALNSAITQLLIRDTSQVWAFKQIGFVKEKSQHSVSFLQDCWAYLCHSPELIIPVLSSLYQRRLLGHFILPDELGGLPLVSLAHNKLHLDGLSLEWKVLQQEINNTMNAMNEVKKRHATLVNRQLPQAYSAYFLGLCAAIFKAHKVTTYQAASIEQQLELIKALHLLLQISGTGDSMAQYRPLKNVARQLSELLHTVSLNPQGDTKPSSEKANDGLAYGHTTLQTNAETFESTPEINSEAKQDIALSKSDLSLIDTLKNSLEKSQVEYAYSQYAGLMFVHNFLKQAAWQEILMEKLSLQYSPKLILRHLALCLLPAAENDPIINIFDGSVFEASAPDKAENKVLSLVLQEDIECFAKALKQAICDRLCAHKNIAQADIDNTFMQMCLRRARIESEVGWVNLFFDMESVDTSLRALGLDFDVNYLPYLTYTVRFYYE